MRRLRGRGTDSVLILHLWAPTVWGPTVPAAVVTLAVPVAPSVLASALPRAGLAISLLLPARQKDDLRAGRGCQLIQLHAPHVRHVHAHVQPLRCDDPEARLPGARSYLAAFSNENLAHFTLPCSVAEPV